MRILAYVFAALAAGFVFLLLVVLSERHRERRPILAASLFTIGTTVAGATWQWITGSWVVFWAILVVGVLYGWHRAGRAPIAPGRR